MPDYTINKGLEILIFYLASKYNITEKSIIHCKKFPYLDIKFNSHGQDSIFKAWKEYMSMANSINQIKGLDNHLFKVNKGLNNLKMIDIETLTNLNYYIPKTIEIIEKNLERFQFLIKNMEETEKALKNFGEEKSIIAQATESSIEPKLICPKYIVHLLYAP